MFATAKKEDGLQGYFFLTAGSPRL